MIYKSFIVEQNILTIEKNKMFLFYGENNGLKNDLKNKIISAFPKTGILNLFQDEIVKDRNILINEISNK